MARTTRRTTCSWDGERIDAGDEVFDGPYDGVYCSRACARAAAR